MLNTTHLWIPEVEEGDGGNYTCELQYGSRVVRRTTQLKVTGRTRRADAEHVTEKEIIQEHNLYRRKCDSAVVLAGLNREHTHLQKLVAEQTAAQSALHASLGILK